jgi:uncharacterized protein (DUF1499 family)
VTAPRPLAPCGSGSCVSTQAPRTDPLRRIEPLAFVAAPDVAIRAVLAAFGRVPRLRILERDDVSVHAVVRSTWIRVPTDVDVRIDAAAGFIHLRASTPVALRERSGSRVRALELLVLIERELRRG